MASRGLGASTAVLFATMSVVAGALLFGLLFAITMAMPNTDPNFGLPNTFLFAFDPPSGQTPTMTAFVGSAAAGAGAVVDPVPNPKLGKGE